MIPKECKRLAEVDFPIAAVSLFAAREKSIRHGHPSTLHLWWARRPLAACRAVLLGLLLPDPSDPHCPADFKAQAWRLLEKLGLRGETDEELRKRLCEFIALFSNWDAAADPLYVSIGSGLVKAAHPDETPLVVDPFAGGGSIPLEALRLGCDAFASDLNPVACLIEKVMLEDIPRYGPGLADELRRAGAEIKAAAEKELAELYPPDPDGATPIAYLWARTVRCESPNCGAEIPLVRSFWLAKKANRRRALRYRVERRSGGIAPKIVFDIFEPTSESDVQPGTVARARATCLACQTVLPPERVRAQLAAQRGGADVIFDEQGRRIGGARMLAVVTLSPHESGRRYRLPEERDYTAAWKASKKLRDRVETQEDGASIVPDEPLPPIGTLGFRVQRYGMLQWGDLFTARQKLALLMMLADIAITTDHSSRSQELLAMTVSRTAEQSSSLVRWRSTVEAVAGTFGRQALPMLWDFVEIVPISVQSSGYPAAVEWVAEVVESIEASHLHPATVNQADAGAFRLPHESGDVWFTDPPYYDAVPYSDLSDFFFVWLKRILPRHPLLQDPHLTPPTL